MASKGKIEADRDAEARRVAARARLDSDVRDALAAGIPADEIARILAKALRESGLLATADEVLKIGREARKK